MKWLQALHEVLEINLEIMCDVPFSPSIDIDRYPPHTIVSHACECTSDEPATIPPGPQVVRPGGPIFMGISDLLTRRDVFVEMRIRNSDGIHYLMQPSNCFGPNGLGKIASKRVWRSERQESGFFSAVMRIIWPKNPWDLSCLPSVIPSPSAS